MLFFLCRQFCLHFWLCVNSSLWYSLFQTLRKSFQWNLCRVFKKLWPTQICTGETVSSTPSACAQKDPSKSLKGCRYKMDGPPSESCFRSLQMRYDIWRGCSHWSMSNGLDTSLSGILAFWYLDTGYLCKGENSNNQFALIFFFAYRINSRYIWLLSCMVIDTLHLGDTSQRLRSFERFGFWFS